MVVRIMITEGRRKCWMPWLRQEVQSRHIRISLGVFLSLSTCACQRTAREISDGGGIAATYSSSLPDW